MNKLELIKELSKEARITNAESRRVVDIFFGSMAKALSLSKRIEIRGLCTFFVKEYKSYVGRNPKTGDKVKVKPKKLPFFKCGKELRDLVDDK